MPGLQCFKRDGYDPVPGCPGLGTDNYDYCVLDETPPTNPPPTNPPPTNPPPTNPSPTSCSLPTGAQWFIITNDGCNDGKVFGLNEEITLIFYNDALDHNTVDKIEVEFRVQGDKKRKTKFKLDSSQELSMNDPSFPSLYPDGTYRLNIRMGDIGGIGGWDNKVLSPPNKPIQPGEWTQYKFKVRDASDQYDIQRSDLFAS